MGLNAGKYYDAQVAVLGCLMIEPELAGEIFHRVRPYDFATAELKHLFKAALELFQAGKPVDPVILSDAAGKGYDELIRQCLVETPTAANWKLYVDTLRNESALHRLQNIADQVMQCTDAQEAREIMGKAEKLLCERPTVRIVPFAQGLYEFANRMDGKSRPNYINWGIRQLNEQLYVEPGDFVVLGAYPSVGKTVLGMQFAYSMATRCRVGVFSLETKDQKLYDRLIARLARINFEHVKQRSFTDDDQRSVAELMRMADRIQLDVINASGMTVNDIRAITLANKYEFIMIDYLQLLDGPGSGRPEIVTNISLALHTMAQSLGVTVLALSQLTPPDAGAKQKQKNLGMFSLRESRQLAQDADVIMLMELVNEEVPSGNRLLKIEKNKEGGIGKFELHFDAEHLEFSPAKTYKHNSVARVLKPQFRELDQEVMTPFDENRRQGQAQD